MTFDPGTQSQLDKGDEYLELHLINFFWAFHSLNQPEVKGNGVIHMAHIDHPLMTGSRVEEVGCMWTGYWEVPDKAVSLSTLRRREIWKEVTGK